MQMIAIKKVNRRSGSTVVAMQFVMALGAVFALAASAAATLHNVELSGAWPQGLLVEFFMPRR